MQVDEPRFFSHANIWASYVHVTFTATSSTGLNRSIDFYWKPNSQPNVHPVESPDTAFGTLFAHAFPPPDNTVLPVSEPLAGDVHFNNDKAWKKGDPPDVFTESLHEIGHSLGLEHSALATNVMGNPHPTVVANLQPNDISRIRELYSYSSGGPVIPCFRDPHTVVSFALTGKSTSGFVKQSLRTASEEKDGAAMSLSPENTSVPKMFWQARGAGSMSSLLAPVRFENNAVRIFYAPHPRNGREMDRDPHVVLQGVTASEIGGSEVRGVLSVDIWEDEKVHNAELWLSDGRKIVDGPVVKRIKEQLSVVYGNEPRRHRLIRFQRFRVDSSGEMVLYGDRFSYQPQCRIKPCK